MFSPTAVVLLVLAAPAPLPRPSAPQSAYLGIDAKAGDGGVLIDIIYISSPAETAGLSGDDLITSIAGKPVRSLADLAAVLRKCKPNEEVPVIVRRGGPGGEEETVQVKPTLRKPISYLGATLGSTRIDGMPEDSPARKAGLKEGDVIVSIDGQATQTREEVVAALSRRRPGDTVPVVVNRDGGEKKVPVKIGERPGY